MYEQGGCQEVEPQRARRPSKHSSTGYCPPALQHRRPSYAIASIALYATPIGSTFFSDRSVLPSYAFPIYNVNAGHCRSANWETGPDLRIALSEYVPGAAIVRARKTVAEHRNPQTLAA